MRAGNLKTMQMWLLVMGGLIASHGFAASGDDTGAGSGTHSGADPVTALTVAGLSSEPGDDDPRILYILPWQPPSIPRRPRSQVVHERPDLLEPIDPLVFERHRNFRETLNPELDSSFTLN